MMGMIEPRRLIIITLSFRSGRKDDLDHNPAQRGTDSRRTVVAHRHGAACKPARALCLKEASAGACAEMARFELVDAELSG